MRMFRCLNANCTADPSGRIGYDFTAEVPVCPQCGADGRDVRMARFILPLAVIHYEAPHPKIHGLGVGTILCDPKRKPWALLDPRTYQQTRVLEQATGEPDAVTCLACKAHADFPIKPEVPVPEKKPCAGCK